MEHVKKKSIFIIKLEKVGLHEWFEYGHDPRREFMILEADIVCAVVNWSFSSIVYKLMGSIED